MKKILFLLIFIVPFVAFSQIWEKADGPYTYNSAFSMFSYNNDLHFYSSKEGYVYRNNTEKEEWLKLDTGFFADKGTIHHFYQNDNVVITTTQDGAYWSFDYGDNWNHFDKETTGITGFPHVLIVDQTIFLQSYSPASLYKLEKGSDKIEKIYTDKNKADSVYGDILVANNDYIFAASPKQTYSDLPEFGKLYISKDKGETWKLSESMKERLVNLLFHNDVLLAFTKEDELYKSTDFGNTWTTNTNIKVRGTNVISYKDLIFACGYQVLVSSDNGESWNAKNDGLDWYSCKDIMISDDKLYYLTGRNLIYNYDYGKKYWNRVSPLTDDIYQRFITKVRDTLFSTGEVTINYSVDEGESWEIYSDSLYFKYSGLIDITISDSIFVCKSGNFNYLMISTNYGKSWRSEYLGIINDENWIDNIIIMNNRIILTSFKEGNFISEDTGLTWKPLENQWLNKDLFINTYIRLSDTDIILYTVDGYYLTYDNGITWEFEKANEEVRAYTITVREGKNLYSAYDNLFYKSTDLGRSWKKIEVNLDPKLIWTKLIPFNGNLIMLTKTGVFVSNDDGKNWVKHEVDLLTPDEKELYFNYGIVSGKYLVLTSEYGNWRAKLSDLGIEVKSSVESEIERNYIYTYPPYPNPAKSEVKFLFYWDINIPMTTDDISIYDITGKKIDAVDKISLVKQESHYGNLIWDCSSAQPGIYLINIKHGTEEKAVKVVVE